MKKIFFLLTAVFFVVSNTFADETVTFKYTKIQDDKINYGRLDFYLTGERFYTAYQIDNLILPVKYTLYNYGETEKVEDGAFDLLTDGTIIPLKKSGKYYIPQSHQIGVQKQEDGSYRISCSSTNNDDFKKTSGIFLSMYIQLADDAETSDGIMKLKGIKFITTENGSKGYPFSDIECNLCTTTAVSNVSVINDTNAQDAYTVSGIKVAKMQKNHLYIVGGKKVLNK